MNVNMIDLETGGIGIKDEMLKYLVTMRTKRLIEKRKELYVKFYKFRNKHENVIQTSTHFKKVGLDMIGEEYLMTFNRGHVKRHLMFIQYHLSKQVDINDAHPKHLDGFYLNAAVQCAPNKQTLVESKGEYAVGVCFEDRERIDDFRGKYIIDRLGIDIRDVDVEYMLRKLEINGGYLCFIPGHDVLREKKWSGSITEIKFLLQYNAKESTSVLKKFSFILNSHQLSFQLVQKTICLDMVKRCCMDHTPFHFVF